MKTIQLHRHENETREHLHAALDAVLDHELYHGKIKLHTYELAHCDVTITNKKNLHARLSNVEPVINQGQGLLDFIKMWWFTK